MRGQETEGKGKKIMCKEEIGGNKWRMERRLKGRRYRRNEQSGSNSW